MIHDPANKISGNGYTFNHFVIIKDIDANTDS